MLLVPLMARRVLLLDDDDIVLAHESARLTSAGFEVRVASSLRSAQHALTSWQPDLIVTDLSLPELTGRELCRWLRDQLPVRVPIVLYANAPDVELQATAAATEVDAYLSRQDGVDVIPLRLAALCDEIRWT